MKKQEQKLPKVFKRKWIAALRSGKYKQGRYTLYRNNKDTFCCLGVAGHICGMPKSVLSGYSFLNNAIHSIEAGKYNIPNILLHDTMYPKMVSKLSSFNDNGKSFNWIAAYIDRYL